MKKRILSMIGVCVLGASVANAGAIQWTSGDLATDAEVGTSLQAGMLVAMYQDVNEDNSGTWYNMLRLDSGGVVTSTDLTKDDIFIGFTTTLVNPFSTLLLLDTQSDIDVQPNGANVYSVIFDAGTMLGATNFVVADSTPFDVGSGGAGEPPVTTVSYSLGTTITGDWQAVPEPAVASLILIFGGSMLVGRRVFSWG